MGSPITHLSHTMVSKITILLITALLPVIFSGNWGRRPAVRTYSPRASKSVLETLVGDDQFSTLVAAVKIAFEDPAAVLASVAPLTVFAPTNDVFAAVPEDTLNGLLADPEDVKSAEGGDLSLDRTVSSLAGSATITKPNILATDGIIHAIDSLL